MPSIQCGKCLVHFRPADHLAREQPPPAPPVAAAAVLCPCCGGHVGIDPRLAGHTVACPYCKGTIHVRPAPNEPMLELLPALPEDFPIKPTGYVAASLLPDEDVVYQTHLHWLIFVGPAILATFFVMVGSWFIAMGSKEKFTEATFIGLFLYLVASLLVAEKLVIFFSSEFAVTTKRVILKTGFIRRRTLELFLNKVDAVSVDQSFLGRLFDYGSVGVSAATEKQYFHFVAAPLRLRKEIQARQTS